MNNVDVIFFTGAAKGGYINIGYVPSFAIMINRTQLEAGASAGDKSVIAFYPGLTDGKSNKINTTASTYALKPIAEAAEGFSPYIGDDFVGLQYGDHTDSNGLGIADNDKCVLICFRPSAVNEKND